ncbi:aminotransferase class V-fold PLP-dependent enzyme [Candidatus Dependentiae bacterium]|nr:aminotransferase class V-fold PLP-dependent enzyme [Candidatus Dependentiae bacterium]
MIEWNIVRNYFPALKNFVYLSSAGGAPISYQTHKEAISFYDEMLNFGDSYWNKWLEKVESVRKKTAIFLNADLNEIAFIQNTSHGMNIIAQMFKGYGDIIVMDDDFPTASIPFFKQDFNIEYVKSEPDCKIPIENIETKISDKTKIIIASSVQYSTGFKQDLKKLNELCKKKNIILVVDASQSICAFPIDVKNDGMDFLVFSGNKWGISGYGIGVIYINKKYIDNSKFPVASWMSVKHPPSMDNKSRDYKDSAAMIEIGGPSFPNIFAFGGTLDLINSIGIDNIENRIIELTDYLHGKLTENGFKIVSSKELEYRSGITIIDFENKKEIAEKLAKKNILVSVRNRGIRASLHFYNNFGDIDVFITELKNIVKK